MQRQPRRHGPLLHQPVDQCLSAVLALQLLFQPLEGHQRQGQAQVQGQGRLPLQLLQQVQPRLLPLQLLLPKLLLHEKRLPRPLPSLLQSAAAALAALTMTTTIRTSTRTITSHPLQSTMR